MHSFGILQRCTRLDSSLIVISDFLPLFCNESHSDLGVQSSSQCSTWLTSNLWIIHGESCYVFKYKLYVDLNIQKQQSYVHRQWLEEAMRENKPDSTLIFLVGTKSDLLVSKE